MKKSGHCPKCDSTRIHLSPPTLVPRNRHFLPISFWRGAHLDVLVCADCGFIERYVSEADDRARIAAKWPRAR